MNLCTATYSVGQKSIYLRKESLQWLTTEGNMSVSLYYLRVTRRKGVLQLFSASLKLHRHPGHEREASAMPNAQSRI